jgi:DHA1 family bicyclomycin/chloramphenicol resistance-like MFS transporter
MVATARDARPSGQVAAPGPDKAALVLTLAALTALGPLSMDSYLPALPALGRDLESGPSVIQLTLTACLTGLALGQLITGPLSDRHGRRRPLLIGAAGYAATSLLCTVAPSATLLIVARLMQGAAGGAAIVISRAIVRDLFHEAAAARIFGTLMQVSGAAPVLAPLVGGVLLKVTSHRDLLTLRPDSLPSRPGPGVYTKSQGGYRTSVLPRVGHNASCLTSIAMPHHLMLTTARLLCLAKRGGCAGQRRPGPGAG